MLKIEFNMTGRHDDLIEEQAYRGAEVVSRRGRDSEEHPSCCFNLPLARLELAASSTSCSSRLCLGSHLIENSF
jgi:hypothetical protein